MKHSQETHRRWYSCVPIVALTLVCLSANATPLGKWIANPIETEKPPVSAASPSGRLAVHFATSVSSSGSPELVLTQGKSKVPIAGQAVMQGWNGSGAQVLWAPDSAAFSVTWSDGGASGGWHLDIVRITGSHAIMTKIGESVIADFQRYYLCIIGQVPPNLSAIKWENGSKRLLIEAQVVPVSFCPKMGMNMGYLVTVPQGKIIKKYSARQLKERWGAILF